MELTDQIRGTDKMFSDCIQVIGVLREFWRSVDEKCHFTKFEKPNPLLNVSCRKKLELLFGMVWS